MRMNDLTSSWEEDNVLYDAEREEESDLGRICEVLFAKVDKEENGYAFLQNLSRLLQVGAKIEKIVMLPYEDQLSQIVLKKEEQDKNVEVVSSIIPTTTIHHFSFPFNPIQGHQVTNLQADHQKVAIHFNGVMYKPKWESTTDQSLMSLMTKNNLNQFSKLSLAQISKICPIDKLCESIYNYLCT